MSASWRWSVLLVLGVVVGCGTVLSTAPVPKVGSAAPEIQGIDGDGVAFKLSDYSGKVVLLDFWQTH
jgi:cytochrome oxidase Cu insertion factor (SCO1/SenC/PrrC family)